MPNYSCLINLPYICRVDSKNNICVSDFGLSKNLGNYNKIYYRQDITVGVKLPVKWMALESIHDAVFSEKSDVVKATCIYHMYMHVHCICTIKEDLEMHICICCSQWRIDMI